MDETESLEALSNLLTELLEKPYDISLHAQHIRLASATGMEDQVRDAREMVTTYWAAGDEVWIPLIEAKEKLVNLESREGLQEILDLYNRAESDYLSIPILRKHVDFLIERHAQLSESGVQLGHADEAESFFSTSWTRDAIGSLNKEETNCNQGHELWTAQRDWEFEMLEAAPANERPMWVASIENLHLHCIQQPHSNHEEIFQSYSSFTTNYKPPEEYEALLVWASKHRSRAVKTYEWREKYENSLSESGYSLAAYNSYVNYERRPKKPDLSMLAGICERAIAEAAKRRFAGEVGAEGVLVSFWIEYVDSLRIHHGDDRVQLKVFRRAVRSIPGSGDIWARYIRFLEAHEELIESNKAETISDAYDRALATGLFEEDPEQIVPLVLARAGYEKRKIMSFDTASEVGDPRFRLEKFLATLRKDYEEFDEAADVWADAAQHYKTSYLAWLAYTDELIQHEEILSARAVFDEISTQNMDWPEAIWEAWMAMEHAHTSLEGLQECLDKVDMARTQVNNRRAKEAEKAQYQAMQIAVEQQAAQAAQAVVSQTSMPTSSQSGDGGVAMDIDSVAHIVGVGVKRKAEDSLEVEESKKAKIEAPQPLKRDRENSTVFVAELPSGTTEDDLIKLFRDCGQIREIKVTQLPNMLVATVEFMERESVPAALTKDKKRLHDQEIAVHLAWESTLYVTNFPEKVDDEFIRDLFGKYGPLFDVRWPSKKFKSTRRFCYVQFASPTSAKAALGLHNHELEPGIALSVYISNPQRKKERTDVDANAREVYVAGLSKFASKKDLEKLFGTYGPIKEVRMSADADGHSKGFAFVEFEQEKDAITALNANNYELKKRRIAVTLADTRVRSRKHEPESGLGKKADIRSRTLHIHNLPAATQEGLLQQVLEKHAPVQKVEVFADKNEAVVEFHNAADVGKMLLLSEPIIFHGQALQLSESSDKPSGSSTGGLFVPRAAKSRPRAGLGHVRKPPVASSMEGTSTQSQQNKGQDDFRKMVMGGK
ncbi:hypothetical protein EW146_g2006 [Bondarzewia mesenterica]|uniref:U4/U6 snRNA-associated-splicing factor PRP24 n=1 Tax=Bondarzewia mesenterica TaxID=1095465 RepID=A0A4S4M3Y0_9AGAM|nr:hypothetical protein EW146_g2006 [Bondarzewia mesenterica]